MLIDIVVCYKIELLHSWLLCKFFLAGTSEAFLHAVGTEDQLKRSNDMLLVFSLVYIVLNILLIRSAGAIGLILANSLSILHPFMDYQTAINLFLILDFSFIKKKI